MKKIIFLSGLLIMILNILNANEVIDGKYSIQSLQTGYCLDIENIEDDAKIIQLPCKEDKESQKFNFINKDDNTYTISSLSIANHSNSNGAHIYNSNEADDFLLEKQTNEGIYKIKSTSSKKYFTSKIFSNDVVQYHRHSTDAQLWRITKNPINDKDIDESLLKVKKIVFSNFIEPKTYNWLTWKFYRPDGTYIPMDDISQIESISGMTIKYSNDIAGYSSANYAKDVFEKRNRRDGDITIVLLKPEEIKYFQVRSTYWIPDALTEEFKLSLFNSDDELLYSYTYTKLGDGIGDAASNNGRIYGYLTKNPLPDIVLKRP